MLIDVMLPGFTCQSSSVTSGDLFLLGFSVDEVSLGRAPFFVVQLQMLSLLISPGNNLANPGCLEQEMKNLPLTGLYNRLSHYCKVA